MKRAIVPVAKYAFVGWAFLLFRVGLLYAGFVMVWTLIHRGQVEQWLVWTGGSALILAIISGIKVVMTGRRVTCPLCRASLFMSGRNLVKPRTKHFLGSRKTPVAFTLARAAKVLDCPYCAERVRLRR